MKCEYCGKEIDGSFGSGRFCNYSCAGKFARKNKGYVCVNVCNYCGSIYNVRNKIKKYTQRFCKDCLPYYQLISMFKKLNLYDTSKPLKEVNKQVVNYIKEMYHNQNKSSTYFLDNYQINWVTFKRFCIKNNIKIRDRDEGVRVSDKCTPGTVKGKYRRTQGSHTSWENKTFKYKSSYELNYMNYLDLNKISYEYEPFTIKYWDKSKEKIRRAIPDFYIPSTNTIVEIKPSRYFKDEKMINELECKRKAYLENGYNCEVKVLDYYDVKFDRVKWEDSNVSNGKYIK